MAPYPHLLCIPRQRPSANRLLDQLETRAVAIGVSYYEYVGAARQAGYVQRGLLGPGREGIIQYRLQEMTADVVQLGADAGVDTRW